MTGRDSVSPGLALGALGVVFGDIGTSPLYAMRTILGEGDDLSVETVYGLTSLVIWSLVLVVSVLYVGLLLRTDNEGEGGLLALVALVRRSSSAGGRVASVAGLLGMAGAAMFLGDSVITPAISVLAAAEGLEVANPSLRAAVLPVALALLVGVFVLQRIGSGRIGRFYGPVMALWFLVLASGGVLSLTLDPGAVQALSPTWAARFVADDPLTGFLSLGAVVLAVTGAEALYADLGHFGRRSITTAWLGLVLPTLVLAYLGEASAVVRDPAAAADPFYAVVPGWATIPVLAVATLATVIASEAVIAGAFTVLHQAGGLGFLPHLRVRHPSPEHAGQIYVPAANWTLAAAVLLVVLGFRSSSALSSAYGVAVSATFVFTVTLFVLLMMLRGRRGLVVVGVLLGVVVLAFLVAGAPKVLSGGWVPLGIGAVLFIVMTTWTQGERRLAVARAKEEAAPEDVLADARDRSVQRVPGAAVFLTRDKDIAPVALRTLVDAGHVLPERAVLLSWRVVDTPNAPAHEATVDVDTYGDHYEGIVAVDVTLGYRERLDVRHVLEEACESEPDALGEVDPDTATYLVSQPIPVLARDGTMALWRQRLFLVIDRFATDRAAQLSLPRDRTIVLGREFDL